MKQIDARGRSCPEPVLMTRAALKADAEGAEILVDNICAAENITRYAAHERYAVRRADEGDMFRLTLTRQ